MLSIVPEFESNIGLALIIPFLFQLLETSILVHAVLYFYWLW